MVASMEQPSPRQVYCPKCGDKFLFADRSEDGKKTGLDIGMQVASLKHLGILGQVAGALLGMVAGDLVSTFQQCPECKNTFYP
jgi:hypothetical protein